jgi:HAD superfamily hydrolase (TIGR01484 family)
MRKGDSQVSRSLSSVSEEVGSQFPSSQTSSKAWSEASESDLKGLKGICLDIDDTLSTSGKLTAEAFSALWNLKEAGYWVVPITGRPSGWCDHIARFWPVDAVVGENGAFTFFMKDGIRKRIDTPAGMPKESLQASLQRLAKVIQENFPHAKWASDQGYREYDLAIDICEDVPTWAAADVQKLLKLCKAEGAQAKLSSIHVNTWYGSYDKLKGFEHWLSLGAPGCTPAGLNSSESESSILNKDSWIYVGDSPNDEPMFAGFCHSVGVANLKRYQGQLKHSPSWMTAQESGAGFVEMARKLVGIKR